jgi:thiol:disulfide interchange protein DsbC
MHTLALRLNQSKKLLLSLAFAGGSLLSQLGWADNNTISKEKIKGLLQNRLGSTITIRSIAATPLTGLYEVHLGNQLVYTDAQARYLVQGHLIDLEKGESLTEARLHEINRVNFADLPLEQSVTVVRGNGQRKLVIFADPNCGYCKKLEKSLRDVSNLTIHTFLTPILSADSVAKSKKIWCATNRGKAWQNWTIHNIAPTGEGKCQTPIEKNIALANKLDVRATPTLLFSDGSRISGAAPLETIERKLSELQ